MTEPKVTLEQWRALLAVVDEGGYAQAAEALGKSQSAVSYAIQKLEAALGVRAFALSGRRAVLTPAGEVLYRRARIVVDEACELERTAGRLALRFEPLIRIAMEAIFPVWLMLEAMAELAEDFPDTRVELNETVLTGTTEALLAGEVDLSITSRLPPGLPGEPLLRVRFVPVAHPDHPLHRLGRAPGLEDLRRHRQLVIRDTGSRRIDSGWLGAEQRWTFSGFPSSIWAARRGMGFAWYPEEKIRAELDQGELKILPLREGAERFADTFLVFRDRDSVGPASRRLGEILQRRVRALTARHG